MKTRISDIVLKDTSNAVRHMLAETIRERKLVGIDGNLTVVISGEDPDVFLQSFDFGELGFTGTIPEEFRNDKVYLVGESLL